MEILDEFVKKHGNEMKMMKSISSTSDRKTKDQWRAAVEAKECIEKLSVGIRQTLPHLLPLVHKIVRSIEKLELSLREYSNREVDFINLLVELVSDEPTVTLRHMIDEEMKKNVRIFAARNL